MQGVTVVAMSDYAASKGSSKSDSSKGSQQGSSKEGSSKEEEADGEEISYTQEQAGCLSESSNLPEAASIPRCNLYKT